jgi:multiple antibiotic resistance protein
MYIIIYVYLDQMIFILIIPIFSIELLLHFIHYYISIGPGNFFNNVLTSTIQLLAVVEPFGIIPILINLTKKMEKETSKALSKTAAVTSATLLMIFAIAGTQILSAFGITVNSFMVAGGALLFIVSLEIMRHGELRNIENELQGTGVVPIAFPLIAGPGAITSVIISQQKDGTIVTLFSIIIVIGITYLVLRSINPIYRILGNRGSEIISRIFAVILAAIAIQYMVEGLRNIIMK